jgi:hypothetical protein
MGRLAQAMNAMVAYLTENCCGGDVSACQADGLI